MSQRLTSMQIKTLLRKLDQRLVERDKPARLFIVGGAAMALGYDNSRVTRDIDALFEPKHEVKALAHAIAQDEDHALDLDDDWLNDGAKGFMPTNTTGARLIFESKRLQVFLAGPEYLLAMKQSAGRGARDLSDAAKLAILTGNTTVEQLNDVMERYYPSSLLTAREQYIAHRVVEKIAELQHDDKHWQTIIQPSTDACDHGGPEL